MKSIIAYIKPHKLSGVSRALHNVDGLSGMSAVDVRGFGRGRAADVEDRFEEDDIGYVRHVRVEVICRDDVATAVVSAVEEAAHTGLRGDGKIFVTPVEQAVRISTGERGDLVV